MRFLPLNYLALLLTLAVLAGCNRTEPTSVTVMEQLSKTIDSLAAVYPAATVAVAIRDAERKITFDRFGDRLFHAASTMKVPVMIEVYRQAELGRFSLDDELTVENAFRSIVDGSTYRIEDDSDDAIYERLGQKMTIYDLVFQMITVSSNLATNLIIDYVSADSVQQTAERLGVRHMNVLRGVEDLKAFDQGLNNTATASDLAVFLEALRDGRAVSEEADQAMINLMLDQAFNEMIPSGLPEGVLVAHKTGQITAVHHDAALVFPPMGEPYVLIILIEGLEDEADSSHLGARIAEAVHAILRG